MSATASAKSIKELDAEARAVCASARQVLEHREDHTPDEVEAAMKGLEDHAPIMDRLEKLLDNKEAVKTLNRFENTLAVLRQPDRPPFGGEVNARGGSPTSGHDHAQDAVKSAGQQFAEDEAFKAWLKAIAPHGRISEGQGLISPAVEIKTLITSAADVTAGRPLLGQPDRRDELIRLGWDQLVLRNLITGLTTNSDSVEVVREKSRVNNAAVVPEATATAGTSGTKPESELQWEISITNVRTIAHWIPVTTRVLQDSRRLRGEIDSFLRQGLEQVLENYILTANDGTNGFIGILNTPGILAQAYDAGVNPLFRTTRKARTKLKVAGQSQPTAYLLHPNDWEAMELTVDAENRYFFADGPFAMAIPRLWGLPVIESVYETEGTGLCGDFRDAVLYDREQTAISVFNQHADFAVRNLVAILAEARMAFHVRRPKSFILIDLTP